MNDTEIVANLIELWKQDTTTKFLNVIWYGSRKEHSDIDLLLLVSDDLPWRSAFLGRLDLLCISFHEFRGRISNFDPRFTEPLLTGEIVYGDETELRNLSSGLNTQPNAEVYRYLLKLSIEQYNNSTSFFDRYRSTGKANDLIWSLTNLGFAYSAILLREQYQKKWTKPLTITEIIDQQVDVKFEKLWNDIRMAKKQPVSINDRVYQEHLESYEKKIAQ
jgi:hypothetical protein